MTKIPDFMANDMDGGKSLHPDDKAYWIERARFAGDYGDYPIDEDRHILLAVSCEIRQAQVTGHWLQLAEDYYPKDAIPEGKLTKRANGDVPVRAHFLSAAVTRLLQLNNAPEAMIADVEKLFGNWRPISSDARARTQAQMIENPEMTDGEVGRMSGYGKSEISRDLKSRKLIKWRPK